MLNTVIIAGNLGADPESFYTPNDGTQIVTFNLAFNSYKEKSSWIKIKCFKKQAEIAEKYLHKGARIAVTGILDQSVWETDSGEKRSSFSILANNIEFIKPTVRASIVTKIHHFKWKGCRAAFPFITIKVQYDLIKKQILKRLSQASAPVIFNSGELADSLAMDHLTGAGKEFIPWFGNTENGYLFMLTKSDNVDGILDLDHKGHTIVAWSMNNTIVSKKFEIGAPPLNVDLRRPEKFRRQAIH